MTLLDELKGLNTEQVVAAVDLHLERVIDLIVSDATDGAVDSELEAKYDVMQRDYPALQLLARTIGERYLQMGGSHEDATNVFMGAAQALLILKEYGEQELFAAGDPEA